MNETPRALNRAFDKVWFSAQSVSLRGSVIADVFAALNARARVKVRWNGSAQS
ncbi:MAG: hypothetical protein JNM09_00695 [Blastocatellia bacterium]|nr:hypothetical protein [Blastocatellia bacterium]